MDLYKKLFQKDASALLPSLLHYQNSRNMFEDKYLSQFKNPLEFWDYASSVHRELSDLAILLLKVCPHAAGVERFWSRMKIVHTDVRNSMKPSVATGVCAVKMQLARQAKKALQSKLSDPVTLDVGILEVTQTQSATR